MIEMSAQCLAGIALAVIVFIAGSVLCGALCRIAGISDDAMHRQELESYAEDLRSQD